MNATYQFLALSEPAPISQSNPPTNVRMVGSDYCYIEQTKPSNMATVASSVYFTIHGDSYPRSKTEIKIFIKVITPTRNYCDLNEFNAY